ncbi:MAG: histidine kinase [Lachnospiraceae bacterium]|nr:histidine kinase [Robinsoniella sp.]MDY3767235.1 histidine kinase [Lachnospiraceae bacterium]
MNRQNIKQLTQHFMPRSLIQKCLLLVTLAMIGAMILLQVVMDHWIYRQVEPGLLKNYSTLVSGVGMRVSYLLHQNSQYVKFLCADQELLEELSKVMEFSTPEEKEAYKRLIASHILPEARGGNEPGAILSSRCAIALVDWQEWVCTEDLTLYMECISQSDWTHALREHLQQLAIDYEGKVVKSYSPVFEIEVDGDQKEFICLAMPSTNIHDHDIVFFMIEPFSEFRNLLEVFEQNQISNYALFTQYLDFVSQDCDAFSDDFLSESSAFVGDEQYEVKQTLTKNGVYFGLRVSYLIEDFKVIAYVPNDLYQQPYLAFIRSANIVLFLLLLVLLGVILFILKKNLSRLGTLTCQIEEIRSGQSDNITHIYGKDEIGILADTFYHMMDEIKENIAQIKRQEKREKEIEYSLLISQIDPHFIYNTLNTITYLAEMNRYQDITIINKALIEMLRDRLKISKLQIYDTIAKEEQQIQYYITIQNYLCGNRISVEFQSQHSELLYPKNILQPLVENSILHGILLHRDDNGEKMKGLIKITITQQDNWIFTEISDNGIGMSDRELHHYFVELPNSIAEFEQDSPAHTHTHIGIYNIRMRLSYLYGEAFEIFAASPGHKGLTITLKFPAHSD